MKFGSIIFSVLLLCNSSYAQLDKFSIGINVQPLTQYIYPHFYLTKYKPQLGINIDYSLNDNHRISLAINTHLEFDPFSTTSYNKDVKFTSVPHTTRARSIEQIELGILYSYKTSKRKKLNMLFFSGIYSTTPFYNYLTFKPYVYLGTGIDYKVSNKINFSFVPNARVLISGYKSGKINDFGAKLGLNYTPFG